MYFSSYPMTPILHIRRQRIVAVLCLGDFDLWNQGVGNCRRIDLGEQVASFLPLGSFFSFSEWNEPLDVLRDRATVGLAVALRVDQCAEFY